MKPTNLHNGNRSGSGRWHRRPAWHPLMTAMAVVVAVSLCGCFGGKPVQTKVVKQRPTEDEIGPYKIGSDDVIDVLVWKQPQLSSRLKVTADGAITMPLIGQVQAAGLTTDQLQEKLTKDFAGYVNDPRVTVRIYNPTSRVFYVIGEVSKPGMYPLMSGEVLSQALAAAGGPTEYANLRKVKIMRRETDQAVEITVNYNALKDGQFASDVPLRRADTIVVP